MAHRGQPQIHVHLRGEAQGDPESDLLDLVQTADEKAQAEGPGAGLEEEPFALGAGPPTSSRSPHPGTGPAPPTAEETVPASGLPCLQVTAHQSQAEAQAQPEPLGGLGEEGGSTPAPVPDGEMRASPRATQG